MIESWLFVLAMIAVLMIPGPTNALLASSAHQQGLAKTSLLVPAELFGYFYAINLWALLIHLSTPTWPYLIDLLHALSAVYVFWLAFHLWKSSHLEKHNQRFTSIRPKQLFFSTLKNPKAVLFAAGIFPMKPGIIPPISFWCLRCLVWCYCQRHCSGCLLAVPFYRVSPNK